MRVKLFLARHIISLFLAACLNIIMASKLQNVVITGANKGLGLELCRQLLSNDRYGAIYALCRKTSPALTELASNDEKLKVVEGLDLLKEDAFDGGSAVTTALQTASDSPTPVHLLIHNAGAYGPPDESLVSVQDVFHSQNLDTITPHRMMYAFQLNAMAPLFVTKALLPNLRAAVANTDKEEKEDDSVVVKVAILSSLVGSIADNTSGGAYAYRAAKTAVNMIGKSLSHDLPKALSNQDQDTPAAKVAVGLVHPGFVFTDFAPNAEPMPGQRPVDVSAQGVLQAIHEHITVETSGQFWHGNYGEGVKPCDW